MALKDKNWQVLIAWAYLAFSIGLAILAAADLGQWIGISFRPDEIDLSNANYGPPLSKHADGRTHWLGTDVIGRDVLAGIFNGYYLSLWTATLATAVALSIGLPLGVSAGKTKRSGISLPWSDLLGWIWAIAVGIYILRFYSYISWLVFGLLVISIFLLFFLKKMWVVPSITLDWDLLVMRLVEVFSGLPGLLILLAISGIFENKSLMLTGIIIGLLRWPVIMVVSRNETLRVVEQNYYKAGQSLGIPSGQLIFKHILPNIATPLWVTLTLGFATAILLESALSFLGIGVALETQTWGSMMSAARNNFSAWWLAVYPGCVLFLTVVSLHTVARSMH